MQARQATEQQNEQLMQKLQKKRDKLAGAAQEKQELIAAAEAEKNLLEDKLTAAAEQRALALLTEQHQLRDVMEAKDQELQHRSSKINDLELKLASLADERQGVEDEVSPAAAHRQSSDGLTVDGCRCLPKHMRSRNRPPLHRKRSPSCCSRWRMACKGVEQNCKRSRDCIN